MRYLAPGHDRRRTRIRTPLAERPRTLWWRARMFFVATAVLDQLHADAGRNREGPLACRVLQVVDARQTVGLQW
jgi:hypothetical protein